MATKQVKEKEGRKTFLPTEFWLKMVQQMDTKTRFIAEGYGYGKITMTFVVWKGSVRDVVFNDELRVRPEINPSDIKEPKD